MKRLSCNKNQRRRGWLELYGEEKENIINRVSTRCRHRFGVEGTKTLQEIIPDLLIDGRFLSTTLDGVGASLLRGTRTLADVKTKSCDDKYPAERSGSACAVATKRQQEVNGKYHKKAAELDLEQCTAPGLTIRPQDRKRVAIVTVVLIRKRKAL